MKKLQSFVLACAGLISISSAISSHAASVPGSTALTLGGGYEWFASKRHLDNSGFPMGILGYNFTYHWGIEAMLAGFSTNFKNSEDDDRQVSATIFLVDGIYRFNTYKSVVEPFITFGVGVSGLSPSTSSANNEGNINAGIGLNYFVHPLVAFRAEARDLYTMIGGKNDLMVDAGITFVLGGCGNSNPNCA